MTLGALTRAVKRAIGDHATRVLILDDVTRLKMHKEADQDVLDLIRDLMSLAVVILVVVGIPCRVAVKRYDPFLSFTGHE